jgi:hypothetical protein
MKTWQKILIPTSISLLIAGVYLFIVFMGRRDAANAVPKQEAAKPLTDDELAFVKKYLFATFDQAKQMEGTNIWVKAGYTLPYFAYAGGTVEFAKKVGVLPPAEKLAVSKVVKAAAPANVEDRVPHGTRQYFVVFAMAGPAAGKDAKSDAKPGMYAAPFGYVQGDQEAIWADNLFYYDDPKTIYSAWPKPVWDGIAAHTPAVGMTENQVAMAAGMNIETDGGNPGDRVVTYHAGPKTWTVTFAKGKATVVKAS